VGDTVYGAPARLQDQAALQSGSSRSSRRNIEIERLELNRNFLHAARLEFVHPVTGKPLELEAPLPDELETFLSRINEKQINSVNTSVT
jgi:23S rRNA pseudouridine1911/1915/1917 synthase